MATTHLPLSSSVSEVLKKTGPENSISASALAQNIFDFHNYYMAGKQRDLRFPTTAVVRPAKDWIDDVQSLYNRDVIESMSKSLEKPMLHGRMLIIGLSFLEQQIFHQLKSSGGFEALVAESEREYQIERLLPEGLTARGKELYEKLTLPEKTELLDSVINWSDDAVKNIEGDLLGRAAFARYLAARITSIRAEEGAYALHLYSPWGAGKTTVLNFVKKTLETSNTETLKQETDQKGERWLVVDFNAWRHQYIDPPWWSLMESVFQQTKGQLRRWHRLQEYYWRFDSGGIIWLISVTLMVWGVVLVLPWILSNFITTLLAQGKTIPDIIKVMGDSAKSVGEIIALIVTVWNGVLAGNRSLLFGAAKAAQEYKEHTNDPMNEIKKRFMELIGNLGKNGFRVLVLIDDLDRCRSAYVVALLEGIQTLFREAPVVFLVASDRRWLNACYEQVYKDFKPQVNELGKSLGDLFLEKAFRFSAPMPGISDELERRYWLYLLDIKKDEQKVDFTAARKKANDVLPEAVSNETIWTAVDNSKKQDFAEQRAIREKAVERLATISNIERLEHTLRPYKDFLEENPRSMKRLVNTYSANLTLNILSETDIQRHQLALWTILSLRWPQLAEFLEEHSDTLAKIGKPEFATLPNEIKVLLEDKEVLKVIKGKGKDLPPNKPLNKKTIESCVQMHA